MDRSTIPQKQFIIIIKGWQSLDLRVKKLIAYGHVNRSIIQPIKIVIRPISKIGNNNSASLDGHSLK